jgi:LPXTG-motif cell wall-anchored protein
MKKIKEALRLVLASAAIGIGASATFFAVVGGNSPVSLTSVASASGAGGGPIVLDGMDPVCHSGWEATGGYIARVLKKAHDGATNPSNGHIAIVGSNGTSNSCGAPWAAMLPQYLGEFEDGSEPTVDFYTTPAEVDNFFSTVIGSTTPPAVVWIPDNWSRSATIEGKFTANAEKIADFVNSGGGLFSNMGGYGWLTALLPDAVYNNGGCNGGPEATADGIADFGLSNEIVTACWHGYFTGDVGTLKTLVDYPYPSPTDTRKAVSIGGGDVSLPSSFTLSISPENPAAGQDLTVTATAITLDGTPQAGVVVTVTVSSGPDAGQTFTATTNASGIATITIRTDSVGTAVYTATATVNGVAKTVSATVTWEPPVVTTTTEPPTTTTTEPEVTTTVPETTVPETTIPETTTTVEPEPETTTTTAPVPTNPPTTDGPTTTHDHSTHEHGPLPNTGSDSNKLFAIGILLLAIGFAAFSMKKGD